MKNLLIKEMRLSASILSYLFIAFAVMALIPSYPILVGGFFVCFGVFQSIQSGRENNDILYTILLPVKKTDAVKAKYIFTVVIQMISFCISIALTFVRMLLLSDKAPYSTNVLLSANPVFLGFLLIIFTVFNTVFLGGFFKTAYKYGIPFVSFAITAFVVVGIAETIHHIPGLTWLNSSDVTDYRLWIVFVVGLIVYVVGTVLSCKNSQKKFEKVDM